MTNKQPINVEYMNLLKIYDVLVSKINKIKSEIRSIYFENETIKNTEINDGSKEWILVHNNDSVKVLTGKLNHVTTYYGIVKERIDDIKPLLCTKCNYTGDIYNGHCYKDCEDCNGTGIIQND